MTEPFRPASLFLAGFAGLLAAVPVRSADLWKHLANGRAALRGGAPSGSWLFDLGAYLLDGLAGGWGVAAGRLAVVVAAAAILLRAAGGGLLAVVGVTLAVLAAGPRLQSLNPVPLLLLAVLIDRLRANAPRWQVLILLAVWANVDRWVWVGVGVAALTLLGRGTDLRRAVVTILLMAGAALLNPAVLTGREAVFDFGGAGLALRSPFGLDYRDAVAASPAGLAYYALLALSAGSFLLGRWRWERFLPWAALAGASAAQARFVPAFAVVAGPVFAWNLAERAAAAGRPGRGVRAGAGLAAAGLLVAAWPGWLIGPPYEPRRLAVDLPAAVEDAAQAVAALGPPGRTLHLSPDTLHGFAWFLPGERAELSDPTGEAVGRFLAGDGADRAVFFTPGPAAVTPAVGRLAAANPQTLAHFGGGAAVYTKPPVGEPFDIGRLAFGPAAAPTLAAPAEWWTPFVRPRSAWSADRGEATAAAALADAGVPTALARHAVVWDAVQAAGLVGAVGPADLAVRLTLLAPPELASERPPPITTAVLNLLRQFAFGRDDAPAGAAYTVVRAARRAVAADPADAAAHHLLGEGYLRLLTVTRERRWAVDHPPLVEIRRVQASAALERAVQLNPRRAASHALLGQLYQETGYLDLAAEHLVAAGERPDDLLKEVAARRAAVAGTTGRVLDRAAAAAQAGLGGEARRLLLGSDVAAFGAAGVELELALLARTGRAADVLAWTTPDVKPTLGPKTFHLLRASAAAALGDYPAADAELAELSGGVAPPAVWGQVVGNRVLNERAGVGGLAQLIWRALGESDFEGAVARLVRQQEDRAEVLAVRGLLALEAGDPATARQRFREAAGLGRPGGAGARMARAGLGWVGE